MFTTRMFRDDDVMYEPGTPILDCYVVVMGGVEESWETRGKPVVEAANQVTDWSVVRIYPRGLHPIGPS
eukprot:1184149-Prorocentrum_minimum.AAC.2